MGRYGLDRLAILERANPADMSGPEEQPIPDAEQVVEQMREATDRLRGQGWKVAPMTPTIELTETEPDYSGA